MKADYQQMTSMFDPKLVEIIKFIEDTFGVEFTFTSLFRPGPGVHGTMPLRGADLSCPHTGLGILVESEVNKAFTYDPNRPGKKCCMYHKVGNGAWHLHLQSHPNTVVNT